MPNLVAEFIEQNCTYAPGSLLPFSEFAERFAEWAIPHEPHSVTKRRIIKELPPSFPFGAHTANRRYIGNLTWRRDEPDLTREPVKARNGWLVVRRKNATV